MLIRIINKLSIRRMAALRANPKTPLHTCPPATGLFKYILSPQYLYEILFYLCLIPLTGYHFIYPFIFTAMNQSISAFYTLQFYKDKFPEEVNGRKALIPHIF